MSSDEQLHENPTKQLEESVTQNTARVVDNDTTASKNQASLPSLFSEENVTNYIERCHDPLPVGTSLAVEEYRNSREEKDTAELHNIK